MVFVNGLVALFVPQSFVLMLPLLPEPSIGQGKEAIGPITGQISPDS
jgi:hypothetical protein